MSKHKETETPETGETPETPETETPETPETETHIVYVENGVTYRVPVSQYLSEGR